MYKAKFTDPPPLPLRRGDAMDEESAASGAPGASHYVPSNACTGLNSVGAFQPSKLLGKGGYGRVVEGVRDFPRAVLRPRGARGIIFRLRGAAAPSDGQARRNQRDAVTTRRMPWRPHQRHPRGDDVQRATEAAPPQHCDGSEGRRGRWAAGKLTALCRCTTLAFATGQSAWCSSTAPRTSRSS